jgi:uncharacterized membrane protein (DUF4010 family)
MLTFVARSREDDIEAMMRFVLIALVIYPVLPDQTYGPYGVLNQQQIWLVVVLFVGIGLSSYLAFKLFGRWSGAVLAGFLGGLISSIATAVRCAPVTRQGQKGLPVTALMIMVASAAVFPRILIEMAVVGPSTFWTAAAPLGIMLGWMAFIAAVMYYLVSTRDTQLVPKGSPASPDQSVAEPKASREEAEPLAQGNPAELLPALIFGCLYGLVLFGAAAARDYFGPSGLYTVAVISGLHDLDAITLSTSRFVEQGQLEAQLGWRLILAGSLSNLVLKGAAIAVLGKHDLLKRIALPYGAALLGGMVLFLLWPYGRHGMTR